MELADICAMVDAYYIAENKLELDQSALSSTEHIYSDGTYDQTITKEGYVKIFNIKNANYLIFIDSKHQLYLSVYKYIFNTKFKKINDDIEELKELLNKDELLSDKSSNTNPNILDGLVDINNMICEECGSNDIKEFYHYEDNLIKCVCNNCGTEYILEPSKYYIIKSKKVINTSNQNTININIKNQNN